MCINPIRLPTGIFTSCHECWQCTERSIDDWVGRCIAESKTAKATHSVTLTYGRNEIGQVDHERAAVLTISDVQKYLKLLRRHGYPVRYLVAGEYGGAKGRAHWHLILFWQGKVPPHELNTRFMERHWPHGFSFWELPEHHAIRYVCKYVQKDRKDPTRQLKLTMSKKPPLGHDYFKREAQRYVDAGLAPQSLDYRFPDVQRKRKDGTMEVVNFRLKARMAEMYVQMYLDAWRATHGDRDWPRSELVDLFNEYGRIVTDENRLESRARPMTWAGWTAERGPEPEKKPERNPARRGPTDLDSWEYHFNKEFDESGNPQRDYLKGQTDKRAILAARNERARTDPTYWSDDDAPRNFNPDGTFRWPEANHPESGPGTEGSGPGGVPSKPQRGEG